MSGLPAYMYMYHVYVWYLWRPEENIGTPGAAVTDDCKPYVPAGI